MVSKSLLLKSTKVIRAYLVELLCKKALFPYLAKLESRYLYVLLPLLEVSSLRIFHICYFMKEMKIG